MKDQILKLRSEGQSYRQIERILGCSRGTINYHCSPEGKSQTRRRRQKSCRDSMTKAKMERGGRCNRCSYDRCLDALDFHHVDPSTKNRTYNSIAMMFRTCSIKKATEEIAKCELICSNCHREEHSKLKICTGRSSADPALSVAAPSYVFGPVAGKWLHCQ